MDINSNTWYVKWFFWSCMILDRFRGLDSYDLTYRGLTQKHASGVNLCMFLQIIWWGMCVLLLTMIMCASVIASLVVMPIYLFGWVTYGLVLLSIVLGLAFVGGAAWLLIVGFPEGAHKAKSWASAKVTQIVTPDPEKVPGFGKLCMMHVYAIKQKYCPQITFKKDAK